MKNRNVIYLLLISAIAFFPALARKEKKETQKKEEEQKLISIQAFLGKSALHHGKVSKKDFDSLLKQGITARDSSGNEYMVTGFYFNYAERNLYEDSVGNLMMLTDFIYEYCPGDSLTAALKNNIFYKTKAGDTAYFDNVKARLPDGSQTGAKGMQFVLTK